MGDWGWPGDDGRGGPATLRRGRRDGGGGETGEARWTPPSRRGHRRRGTAGAVLAAMLLGFFLAGLLDAGNLKGDAQGMTLGARRSLALALVSPMASLSGALRLDGAGRAIDSALGRTGGSHHTLAQARHARPLWPRAVTPARPLRLYIAGDSMAQVFGSSLVNLSAATGRIKPVLDYHVSTGLSRPDYFDWPQRLIDQIVDLKPDAVVVLFGANDAQSVSYQGQRLTVGTMAWRSVYQRRVAEAMDILSASGRRVYWVGDPVMRDKLYSRRVVMMDAIYAAEAKRHKGVVFVSTWALMAGGKGSYAATLPGDDGQPVAMRAADGVHLTRAGGDRMARAVLDVIAGDWGLRK